MPKSRQGRSIVACSVLHGALGKRHDPGSIGPLAREGAAFLGAGGYAMGVFAVLFAVDPLEQDIQQEVASEDAKRQKNRNRHKNLTQADTNERPKQP